MAGRTGSESGLSKIGRSLGLRGAPKSSGEPNVATALPTHDPFKATFHFCLGCRQYTCEECWNPDGGYCQTCVPLGALAPGEAERGAAMQATPASGAAPVERSESAWPTK